MYDSILLPVNGSHGNEAALRRALSFVAAFDATVHVLHVIELPPEPADLEANDRKDLRRVVEQRGKETTATVAELAEERDIEVVEAVIDGVANQAIREYARTKNIDLIVMGTHGHRGADQIRLGSTTERVLMLSEVPVLSIPATDERTAPADLRVAIDDVVIPTDGSRFADRAAEHGLSIAELSGATIHAIYVVDEAIYDLKDAPRSVIGLLREGGQQTVDAIASEARDRGLSATSNVLRGNPEMEILKYTKGVDADLVTMGTRGRAAGSDRVIGSTTARIVRRFDRPLLTVG